jgi:hypothetical protein
MASLPHDVDLLRPRKTVYRGILMRSTLESRVAQILDTMPALTWEYEPARYADTTGGYLPDFVVRGLPCHLFLEVKGPPQSAEQRAETVRGMLRVWASVPDAGLSIWTPATLHGEPFEVIRQGQPIARALLAMCAGCGAGRIVNADVPQRQVCRVCEVAA